MRIRIALGLLLAVAACSSPDASIGGLHVVRMFGGLELFSELAIETDDGSVYACANDRPECENQILELQGATSVVSNAHATIIDNDQYCAVLADTTVVCATCSSLGVECSDWKSPIDGLSGVASMFGSCAILRSGEVQCWDSTVITPPDAVKQIACGYTLMQSGALIDTVTSATVLTAVLSVSCTMSALYGQLPASKQPEATYCAINTDSELYCWGSNSEGQLGDGTFTDRFVPTLVGTGYIGVALPLSIEGDESCGLKQDGTLWCWGKGLQLLDAYAHYNVAPFKLPFENITQIASAPDFTALSSNGTLVQFSPGATTKTTTIIVL